MSGECDKCGEHAMDCLCDHRKTACKNCAQPYDPRMSDHVCDGCFFSFVHTQRIPRSQPKSDNITPV
jgi:hypothetical protein